MTAPGIGPVTALRFVAAIDEPGRFATAHRVQSYLGLTPGEHSSSERERRTGITKAGTMELRRTLIQARLGSDVLRSYVASDDRLGPAADRTPWPTGRRGGAC